jgi:hypothetical protein
LWVVYKILKNGIKKHFTAYIKYKNRTEVRFGQNISVEIP